MKGYAGKRMSRNAIRAYMRSEMPKSKWTKAEILAEISDIAEDNGILLPNIKKLTKDELFETFLYNSSWHHTGCTYNKTNFFAVSENAVLSFTETDFSELLNMRNKHEKNRKKNTDFFHAAQDTYLKLEIIYLSKVLTLKTLSGIVRKYLKDDLDLSSTYDAALNTIADKDLAKVQAWERLPEGHRRQESAKLYHANIEEYVRKYYNLERKSNKLVKEIQKKLEEEYHDV